MDRPAVPAALAAAAVILTIALPPAAAQTGPELLIKPLREEDQFELNADWAIGLPSETDAGFDARVDFLSLNGRLRLTPGTSEEGFARAQPRVGVDLTSIIINSPDPRIPGRVQDASVAYGMGIFSAGGWLGGFTVGYGQANADNQDDANAAYLEANFAVGKTFESGDSLGVVVNYDGNRTILPDVPLLGFQYQRELRDDLTLSLGFPFSGVEWRPTDRLEIDAQYLPPFNFEGEVSYRVVGQSALYTALQSRTLAVHWDELDQGSDRLFVRQFLAEAGLKFVADPEDLEDKLGFRIGVGWAFGQDISFGWDRRDPEDLAEIDDNLYLRVSFELRI